MYTKETCSLFGATTSFYKDGHIVARKRDGVLRLCHSAQEPVEITRAQGFRYWGRHFPLRACWDLPEALAAAVGKDCRSFGTYVRKDGEVVGYAG